MSQLHAQVYKEGEGPHALAAVQEGQGLVAPWRQSILEEKAPAVKVSAVDFAVYTRTRHFRTAWSSKGGK
jgi:hypothetical protein